MLRFKEMGMVNDDGRYRYVFTITNYGNNVSIMETSFINDVKLDNAILHHCDPEIVSVMIQQKHMEGYSIKHYK